MNRRGRAYRVGCDSASCMEYSAKELHRDDTKHEKDEGEQQHD